MHRFPPCFLLILVATVARPSQVSSQELSRWFAAASFGPVIQDRGGNDLLQQSGLVVSARAGRRLGPRLSAVIALTHTSVAQREAAVTSALSRGRVPCPDGDPLPCGPEPFAGPVKAAIGGVGLEASAGSAGARVFAEMIPGIYWMYERAPEARAASAGLAIAAGGAVRLMRPMWLALDLQYHRIFSEGPSPRWLVPVALGLQLRE